MAAAGRRRRAPASGGMCGPEKQRQGVDQVVQHGGKRRHHAVAHPLVHLAVFRRAEGERAIEPPGGEGRDAHIETSARGEGVEPEAVEEQREHERIDRKPVPPTSAKRTNSALPPAPAASSTAPPSAGHGQEEDALLLDPRTAERVEDEPAAGEDEARNEHAHAESGIGERGGSIAPAGCVSTKGGSSESPSDPEDRRRRAA